jgi:hypothetical protein
VGEWLKGRRNALIDAALVYCAAEWVAPAVVSAVLYLGSSEEGIAMLFVVAYELLLATAVIVSIKRGPPAQVASPKEGEWVYVWGPRPIPFMLGGGGGWVRVNRQ